MVIKVKGMIFRVAARRIGALTTATARAQLVMGLATLALAVCVNASSTLACVVGTGTAGSCSEAAFDACLPGGGSFDGTVTFNCGSAPKTITLSTTKAISADTTVDGGSTVTLQNSGSDSFAVNASAHFTVENLTLSGSGDGIDSIGGPVTATNCTFTGNFVGISVAGTVTATGCTFTGNDIGISAGTVTATGCTFTGGDGISASTVTATNSTFTGESTGISALTVTATNCTFAGYSSTGISAGTVTTTNSTFTGTSDSIGISAQTVTATNCTLADNGDFGISAGTVTATNCTFAHNGEGISAGDMTITNCTFTGNGNGIDGGPVTVTNTILTNSTFENCVGSFTDGGHNIDDGTTCGFTGTGCTNPSGTSFCNTDPKLDPAGLKNNGGPTQTIALLAGSRAIDHGNQGVCGAPPVNNVDQRGLPRSTPSDPICDIGAFEVQQQGPASVVPVPAASPAGLIGLAVLLGTAGWLVSRRRARQ